MLNEWREKAKDKLSSEEEALIQALSIDGYHGWGQMYDTIVGSMEIPYDGEMLSIGQANNLSSHQDENVRKEIFDRLENALTEKKNCLRKH